MIFQDFSQISGKAKELLCFPRHSWELNVNHDPKKRETLIAMFQGLFSNGFTLLFLAYQFPFSLVLMMLKNEGSRNGKTKKNAISSFALSLSSTKNLNDLFHTFRNASKSWEQHDACQKSHSVVAQTNKSLRGR